MALQKILREVYSDRLPASTVNNYEKIGFMTPFDDWMNKDVTNNFITSVLNSDSFRSKSIWDASKIKTYLKTKTGFLTFLSGRY